VTADAMLELHDVGKSYGPVSALRDVTLTLARGRFLALLGPSGSGKSTLIRCLAGVERVSTGTIRLGGEVVADERRQVPPERRDLAMVFQDFALWPHLTVERNVGFALRRRRVTPAEGRQRVSGMLDRVGLAHLVDRYPHELSGGEQQRVALARALVGRPSLLLFDEPLSSLDANLRERLRIEIATLVHDIGASAVYITHDQHEAFALGDEIGVLQDGAIVQHDRPEHIYRRPLSAFVARFTGVAGTLHGRVTGRGEGDRVRVTVAGPRPHRPPDVLAVPMDALSVGEAAQVLLRPTAIGLTETNHPLATLHGIVADVAFRGRGYDHAVELDCGSPLTEVYDEHRQARGARVGVTLDPAACLAYRDDAGTAPPAPTTFEGRDAWLKVPDSDPSRAPATHPLARAGRGRAGP